MVGLQTRGFSSLNPRSKRDFGRAFLFLTRSNAYRPLSRVRHFFGLSERGWCDWSEEIRRRCREELLRRGMFPPRRYFNGGE
jgi:hypothetical protein